MQDKRHALVIGGSIGGLFAAILLRQAGWTVTLYERSRGELASRGAGLGVTHELISVMRRAGAQVNMSAAVPINSFAWVDRSGGVVYEHARPMAASTWPRIYLPLWEIFPAGHYRAGMSLTAVEPEKDGATALFADGTRVRADLLVAADGNQSTIRRQLMPEVEPRYAGYVAWRGIMDERDLPADLKDVFFDKISYSFPEGEMSLSMPVPGPGDDMRPGHRRYYFIWYRPTDLAGVGDLCTDAIGNRHGTSIPPPLIRPEFVREIKDVAGRIFAPNVAAIVRNTAQPLLQPIFDMEAPRLVEGRVALLGDAAFVARPHVAAGTTKAALDAACLADSLTETGGDIDAALQLYGRQQHDFGSRLVAHARYLGAYLEGRLKPPSERRGDEIERDPRRIMHDYGAPHLVHDLDPADLAPVAGRSDAAPSA